MSKSLEIDVRKINTYRGECYDPLHENRRQLNNVPGPVALKNYVPVLKLYGWVSKVKALKS